VRTGTEKNILWGEVDKVDDELFWCHGGAKLPTLPIPNGTTDGPFFLASLAGPIPNLNAISLDRGDVRTTTVYCLYSKEIKQQCESRNRTKELSAIENLLNKYG
jgi:hypothetical protein